MNDRTHEERPSVAFDLDLREALDAVLELVPTPMLPEHVELRRQLARTGNVSDDDLRCDGEFEILHRVARANDGVEIPLLLCKPTRTPGPHPVVLHLHGGGMVAGSNRSRELLGDLSRAEEFQLAVVSPAYRVAPEHQGLGPVSDCMAALRWLLEHAEGHGLRADRIVLSGNSAGAALAAGVALMARDVDECALLGLMLMFPMLDDRCETPSVSQFEQRGLWDGRSNMTGWSLLLGDDWRTTDVSPYASPARATDLTRLAPTWIEVGSAEAVRDEAVSFASRLWSAGVSTELHVWSGGFHSFDEWAPAAALSTLAADARRNWLGRLLRSS